MFSRTRPRLRNAGQDEGEKRKLSLDASPSLCPSRARLLNDLDIHVQLRSNLRHTRRYSIQCKSKIIFHQEIRNMSIENYAKSSQFYQVRVHKQQVEKTTAVLRWFLSKLIRKVIFNATSLY